MSLVSGKKGKGSRRWPHLTEAPVTPDTSERVPRSALIQHTQRVLRSPTCPMLVGRDKTGLAFNILYAQPTHMDSQGRRLVNSEESAAAGRLRATVCDTRQILSSNCTDINFVVDSSEIHVL